ATRAGFMPAGGVAGPLPPSAGQPGGASPMAGSGRLNGAGREGLAGADGLRAVRPIGPPRPTLVVAGCDPALPLLEMPLALLDPPVSFTWWPCGSREALRLAAAGLVHVAGAHLRGESGEYNTGPAAERLRRQG